MFHIEYHPCAPNPCENGGACISSNGTNFTCDCPTGYFGNKCQTDPCSDKPCENGGSCISESATNFTCKCEFGFHGENCEFKDGKFIFEVPLNHHNHHYLRFILKAYVVTI